MKEYSVKYYLGDMLHGYIIKAECEADAIATVLRDIQYSASIMHDFEITLRESEW